MPTIERRVTELEHTGTCNAHLLVVLLDEIDAEQGAAIQEASLTGRQVIKVRFVRPDRATEEQRP